MKNNLFDFGEEKSENDQKRVFAIKKVQIQKLKNRTEGPNFSTKYSKTSVCLVFLLEIWD